MVTKKTPAKSPAARKIMVETPVIHKRTSSRSSHNPFSYSFVAFLTVLAMLAVEAIFGLPSRWLHGEVAPKPVPEAEEEIQFCTREYMPVCGKNGKTYPNTCEMENAGATIDYTGECKGTETTSGADTTDAMMTEDEASAVNTPLPDATESATPALDTSRGWTYTSRAYGYSVTVPRNSYYSSTRSGDGEVFTVDPVQSKAGSPTAMVVATFTKTGGTAPADATQTLNVANGTLSLSYSEPLSKQGKEIVDFIVATAK